jgi:periplasmic protein TonB
MYRMEGDPFSRLPPGVAGEEMIVMRQTVLKKEVGKTIPSALFQRNLVRGLVLSIVFHFGIIASYYAQQYLGPGEEAPVVHVRLMKYSELGPPPSIMNSEQLPVVGVTIPVARPTVGIPVPVPDLEVNPEQTIATQRELSQLQSPVSVQGGKSNDVVEQPEIKMDEEEPELDAFVPVEKLPVPITQVQPVYPDMARRAGVEGVVWVKILLDKQGRAKKAVIVKSDTDIFNDVTLEAAMKWVFTPAVMNNGPVMVWVSVPFRFRLTKEAL